MRTLITLCLAAPLCGQLPVQVTGSSDAGAPIPGHTAALPSQVASMPADSPLDTPVPLTGWPLTIGSHGNISPTRGLTLADLDSDGKLEVIRPGTDGRVYVWRHDGTAFPGWPQTTIGLGQYAATVADLDGDGSLEILVATRGLTSGGRAYVFRSDGTLFPGWPLNFSNHNISSCMTAADLDGDGRLEVIFQERAYPIGYVHVYRFDGTPFGASWPVALDHVPASTPSVADIDADGAPEVVCTSYKSLYVLAADGTPEAGFPYDVNANHSANFSYQSAALADLDGDGKLEIVTACHQSGSGCYVFRYDGTLQPGWPKSFGGSWSYCPPTVMDWDGDGSLDVLCGRAGGTVSTATMYAWDAAGVILSGFPIVQPGGAEAHVAVADIDDDGNPEVYFDSNLMDSATSMGWLWGVDHLGQQVPGFPLRVPGFTHLNGANFGDVDGDGVLEMGVVSRDGAVATVSFFKLTGTSSLGRTWWRTYHEGNARRGVAAESDRFGMVGDYAPGGTVRFELQGTGGNLYVVVAGLRVGLMQVPPVAGFLRVDPALPVTTAAVVVLPADGRSLQSLNVPNNPVLQGLFLAFQGAELANPPVWRQLGTLVVQ